MNSKLTSFEIVAAEPPDVVDVSLTMRLAPEMADRLINFLHTQMGVDTRVRGSVAQTLRGVPVKR